MEAHAAECVHESHTHSPSQAYSRALRARQEHARDRAVAGFCVAAVRRVRQHFRERRTLESRTHRCGRKTLLTEERKRRLLHLVSEQPDATLAELGARMDRPFRTSTVDL